MIKTTTLGHLFERKASNGRLRSLISRLLERGLQQTAAPERRVEEDLSGRADSRRGGQTHHRAHRAFLVPRRPRISIVWMNMKVSVNVGVNMEVGLG